MLDSDILIKLVLAMFEDAETREIFPDTKINILNEIKSLKEKKKPYAERERALLNWDNAEGYTGKGGDSTLEILKNAQYLDS